MRSLVLLLPLIELALLIGLGAAIGAGPTFLVIAATGLLGFILLGSARRAAQAPRTPQAAFMPMMQGGPRALSGALLLIPGILTDLLGLVLLIPAPRRWIVDRSQRYMFKRVTGMDMSDNPLREAFEAMQRAQEAAQRGGGAPDGGKPLVIDAEVTSVRDATD